jgi:hypothetical protein
MHHNKIEPECKLLKNNLIKIALKYKNLFLKLGEKYSFDNYQKDKLLGLKRNYEVTFENSIDKIYFKSVLGKDFISKPLQ